ncbi:hypothetical protein CCACVL1_12485, partial [Corchorus capsularis]
MAPTAIVFSRWRSVSVLLFLIFHNHKISGPISPEFAKQLPLNATINLCSIPSTFSSSPNTTQSIPSKIAMRPKSIHTNQPPSSTPWEPNNIQNQAKGSLKPGTIATIAVANLDRSRNLGFFEAML